MENNIYLGFFFTGLLLFALIIVVIAHPGAKREKEQKN
jgi:hypothetical protein